MRRIFVESNIFQAIGNEMIMRLVIHFLLFELHLTRPKCDV